MRVLPVCFQRRNRWIISRKGTGRIQAYNWIATVEARLTNGTFGLVGTILSCTADWLSSRVVGDSIFAGSMGGAPHAYDKPEKNNREKDIIPATGNP